MYRQDLHLIKCLKINLFMIYSAKCLAIVALKFLLMNYLRYHSANFHQFKFNNRNSRKSCEICSKFTIKAPE